MLRRVRTWLAGQDKINRLAISVAAVGLIAFCGYRIWDHFSVERRAKQARAALDRRDPKAARELLNQCLKSRPDSGELNFLAARAARLDRDYREADRLLTRCKELDWVENAILLERALLRAQAGDFRSVEPALLDFLRADPPLQDADFVLDVAIPEYLREYDLSRVFELLQKWIGHRPNDLRLRLWLYEAAHRLHMQNEASDALRAAIGIAPDDPDVRLKLGQQLLLQRRADEAKPHFEWLLARSPNDPRYRLGMARCEQGVGNTEAAVRLLDGLLAGEPNNPEYLAHRGYVDFFGGRPKEALPWLRKAVERSPHDVTLLGNFAKCLEDCGLTNEAREVRDRAAQVEADLREMGAVTKAVYENPRDPEPRYKAGTIMARNGQELEARRWFASALEIDPNHQPSLKALRELANKSAVQPRR